MIIGIGNDLIEIERVRKACRKEAFLLRIFTDREIELYSKKPASLAGNFAVKEAVSKTFGTGFRGFEPKDIEVLRDEAGRPYVNLYGGAMEMFKRSGGERIFVSISNTKEYAAAVAVLEGE